MASEITTVEATDKVLRADGILDNLVASVKVPFTEADHVEKSVALTGMIVSGVLCFFGGIAFEARDKSVPFISDFLRPSAS